MLKCRHTHYVDDAVLHAQWHCCVMCLWSWFSGGVRDKSLVSLCIIDLFNNFNSSDLLKHSLCVFSSDITHVALIRPGITGVGPGLVSHMSTQHASAK